MVADVARPRVSNNERRRAPTIRVRLCPHHTADTGCQILFAPLASSPHSRFCGIGSPRPVTRGTEHEAPVAAVRPGLRHDLAWDYQDASLPVIPYARAEALWHHQCGQQLMSALGQKRIFSEVCAMSARAGWNVRSYQLPQRSPIGGSS